MASCYPKANLLLTVTAFFQIAQWPLCSLAVFRWMGLSQFVKAMSDEEVIKIGDVMLDRIACQYRLSFFEDYLEKQEQVKPIARPIETCQSRKGQI